jgi:hypothetical protein
LEPPEELIEFVGKFEAIRIAALRIPRLTPPLEIQPVAIRTQKQDEQEDLEFLEIDSMVKYLPFEITEKPGSTSVSFDKVLGLTVECSVKRSSENMIQLTCLEQM